MNLVSSHFCFAGEQRRYAHRSSALDCEMHFSVYLPPAVRSGPAPVLFWLSGLTCTDENFVTKAGAQRYAAERGVALVAPDTSPRGTDVPDDPDNDWDFGHGAGFYLDATQSPWSSHYQMETYITAELPEVLAGIQGLDGSRTSIMGHSMGGHGALSLSFRHPSRYMSVSAFAPICAPSQCPWGEKAFGRYLGDDPDAWRAHDTCALIAEASHRIPLLVDQGEGDPFIDRQLMPDQLRDACTRHDHPLNLRLHPGYDHSYFFIATFIGEHIAHHAAALDAHPA